MVTKAITNGAFGSIIEALPPLGNLMLVPDLYQKIKIPALRSDRDYFLLVLGKNAQYYLHPNYEILTPVKQQKIPGY